MTAAKHQRENTGLVTSKELGKRLGFKEETIRRFAIDGKPFDTRSGMKKAHRVELTEDEKRGSLSKSTFGYYASSWPDSEIDVVRVVGSAERCARVLRSEVNVVVVAAQLEAAFARSGANVPTIAEHWRRVAPKTTDDIVGVRASGGGFEVAVRSRQQNLDALAANAEVEPYLSTPTDAQLRELKTLAEPRSTAYFIANSTFAFEKNASSIGIDHLRRHVERGWVTYERSPSANGGGLWKLTKLGQQLANGTPIGIARSFIWRRDREAGSDVETNVDEETGDEETHVVASAIDEDGRPALTVKTSTRVVGVNIKTGLVTIDDVDVDQLGTLYAADISQWALGEVLDVELILKKRVKQ